MKQFSFIISLVLITLSFGACNPAEDKIIRTHTITQKHVNVMKDTLSGSKVISKLRLGDEIFYPNTYQNGWAHISVNETSSITGYIKSSYFKTDTTTITHSSVLRNEYKQTIVPALDEKIDSVAQKYLSFFPIKNPGFWSLTIAIAIGIAIFYGIADIKCPLGVQLFALIAYSPVITWIAFNTQQHGFSEIDSFWLRLIILLGMLVLTIVIALAITASVGKLVGHGFTFRYCTATTVGIYLLYFGIAYFHSLSDLFFKFLVFIYAVFFLYFLIKRVMKIKQIHDDGDGTWWIYIKEIISIPIIFVATTAFIGILYIPMQYVSSILITQLSGLLLIAGMVICGFSALTYNSPKESIKPSSVHPVSDYNYYGLREMSDGYWYDKDGNKYVEESYGNYREL